MCAAHLEIIDPVDALIESVALACSLKPPLELRRAVNSVGLGEISRGGGRESRKIHCVEIEKRSMAKSNT
jgi:hypothetical protein